MTKITLRPFQVEDAAWLPGKPHAFLLHETRVGKTFSALAGYAQGGGTRLAVLGPAIARGVWRRGFEAMESPGTLLVDSYERLVSNAARRQEFAAFRPDVLVLDEAHRLRSPSSKRTRLVYGRHSDGVGGLVEQAGAVWRLSGTLAPKHLGETWTHLHAAGRTTRSHAAFERRYTTGFESIYGWKATGIRPEHREEYRALLAPISRRLRRRDVYTTPEPLWNTIPLEVTATMRAEIAALAADAKLDRVLQHGSHTPEQAARLLEDIELGAPHLHALLSRVKMPLVAEQAQMLLDGGIPKLVVVGWHKPMIEGLHHALRAYGAEMIYGATSETQRWKRMDRFQSDPECRVLVGQIASMSESIALHAARHILFAEYPWSAGMVLQAATRIFSPEHTEPMEIMVCTVAGTIDDAVASTIVREAEQHRFLNTLGD